MTSSRLHAILDAYGADPARWPAGERDAALALLARSPEARRQHDAAARLDAALDVSPVEVPSPALAARVLRATPRPRVVRVQRWVAAVAPLAVAAALVLWIVRAPAPAPLTADAIAALGTFSTPTDTLLFSTGSDLVDLPGCSEGELGCIDLGTGWTDESTRRDDGRMRA